MAGGKLIAALLQKAARILVPGGSASVMHGRCDLPRPRGPAPSQWARWERQTGFSPAETLDISAAALYHYGMRFTEKELHKRQIGRGPFEE